MNKNIASFFIYFLGLALVLPVPVLALGQVLAEADFLNGEADASNQEIVPERATGEIIVKFKNGETEVIKDIPEIFFQQILEEYSNKAEVDYAEPNFIYRQSSLIPNDVYYSNQWYLQKIKAPAAWGNISRSPAVTIAVIDSGIQVSHPDLAANIWRNFNEIPNNGLDDDKNGFIDDLNGWDFVKNVPDPSPKFEAGFSEEGVLHGTIVAGVTAAVGNNNEGVAGVTWKAKIMPLRVLNDLGEGRTSEVVRAVDYAILNGADIINFSFVGMGYSRALYEAIRRAYNAGIVVVAAAGNEQEEGEGYNLNKTPMYPVCHDGENGDNMVIGVAATDTLDQKTSFSSYGSNCIDIAAPGIRIFGASVYDPTKSLFNNYYNGYWSGTSMAAPMVSGAIALIEAANPKMDREQVIKVLLSTTDDISRLNPQLVGQLGSGRLNLAAGVEKAIQDLISQNVKILTSPYSARKSQTKIVDFNGNIDKDFLAYPEAFRGGRKVIGGDVNGDGLDEIITGAGPGGGPQVRIFNAEGKLEGQFFAYNKSFRGGVTVAAGDVNGDGLDEIITGVASRGDSEIRVFNGRGKLLNQFFAYNKAFRGGVTVAAGDVNGDGLDEIITGAGPGGGPQVRIFNAEGKLEGQFFAYNSSFRGGVRVAVGDVDGGIANKKQEIITAPGPGGGPHVRVFDSHGKIKGQFFAYSAFFKGGVEVAAGDIDNDGLAEIITGAGPGGTPHVIAFETTGAIVGSFYAYEDKFNGGVSVGVAEIKKSF